MDQVVVVSSATVYGAWANNPVPLTEDAPLRPNPEFAYAVHKAQVERLVTDWADAHAEASVAVLRPALALAEDGAGWITRCLTGAAGIRAGDNDPPMQFLHLDDLASAVEHVRRERLSGPFNVAPVGWIPGDTARALVGDGPRLHLPDGAATRLAEWSWRMRLGPMPPGLVPYTQYPWVVASDRLRASGWEPRWSNEEAFRGWSRRLAVVDAEPEATPGARARSRRRGRGRVRRRHWAALQEGAPDLGLVTVPTVAGVDQGLSGLSLSVTLAVSATPSRRYVTGTVSPGM